MAILLKTASVRVSSIQIMQVRVQNKGRSVWKSRYVGDVSIAKTFDYINRVNLTLPLSVYEGTWTHSPPLVAMHLLDRS